MHNLATSGAPDKSNTIGNEKVTISKCGDQWQNEQNLVTTFGAPKRSNSTENEVTCAEGELDKHMDKQKKVGCDQLMDRQNKVNKAHRQKDGGAQLLDKQNKVNKAHR